MHHIADKNYSTNFNEIKMILVVSLEAMIEQLEFGISKQEEKYIFLKGIKMRFFQLNIIFQYGKLWI